MRCKGCGDEISSNQLYCTHCGRKNEQGTPTYDSGNSKSNHKMLIPIVIGGIALLAIMGILILSSTLNIVNHLKIAANGQKSVGEDYNDISDVFDNSEDVITDDTFNNDLFTYSLKYSYTELPDAVSIDSDERFIYYDYYIENEVRTYVYQFNNADAEEADFYTAITDYGSLLMNESGYSQEEDIGEDTYYYVKGDVAIGITALTEGTEWYAYIDIYCLSEEQGISTTENEYPNYSYYLESRDVLSF